MSKDKETLVILIPGFPESEADSTCLPSQQYFVRSLKEQYPKLKIIVFSFQYPYHKEKYNWFDVDVIPFSGKNNRGFYKLLLRQKIYSRLQKLNRTNKIIGLLSLWYGECALVGHRFGKKHNIKHYCWIRGQDARLSNKYPARVKPVAGELIALSDFLQEQFERSHGVRPMYVLPSGTGTKPFPPSAEKVIDILAAGSLIPLKQFDVFLQILAEIKKHIPTIKAVLIGDGPEKDRLQKLITASDLRENITLAGELPHPVVLQWMQKTKLFLHSSSYEGFSAVCLEALHARCHVISFCKAMNQPIDQWHIVSNKEEMTSKAIKLLQSSSTRYKQVIAYPVEESAKKIMQLFTA